MGLNGTVKKGNLMTNSRRREAIEGYLFLLPNFVLFIVFFAVPLIQSFYYSLTNFNMFTTPSFVGVQNYIKALGFSINNGQFIPNDPTFWTAIGNTVLYAIGVILLSVLPAFLLAWMLNSKMGGMTIFRALLYIPVVASIVGSALVWNWIFHGQVGVLNTVITAIVDGLNSLILNGIGRPLIDPNIQWLLSSDTALLSLIIMTSWATIGYNMVIFLASLQGIPASLYEAATVDGSSRWNTLLKIIVPMMTPTIFFILVTNTISSLQIFSEPYIMTLGGPANSTLTIVYYLYQKGFQRFQMGYGASLAWIVFAFIFLITIFQFRLSNRWVFEE